jgi:CheY-like chemotaxis protein/HPt (histidine-containing phosphotransfer) domain-containing protein
MFDAILRTLHQEKTIDESPAPPVDIWHPCVSDSQCPSVQGLLRILVAEDNEINRRLVARLLEKQGHEVSYAKNGHEVLAATERQSFDLILMDVQMPQMDGLEAATNIREKELGTKTHTPILAMTAHTLQSDRDRCLAAGMDGFISKPLRKKEFLQAIAQACGPGIGEGPEGEVEEKPIVDVDAVLLRFDNDKALLQEAVELFQHGIPRLMSQLREAVDRGDLILVERIAHSIKGSAGNFGGMAAAESATNLEWMARKGDLSEAAEVLENLEGELDRLIHALAQLS